MHVPHDVFSKILSFNDYPELGKLSLAYPEYRYQINFAKHALLLEIEHEETRFDLYEEFLHEYHVIFNPLSFCTNTQIAYLNSIGHIFLFV